MRRILFTILTVLITVTVNAQIDRYAVISRNCPVVNALDTLSSLTVGNGGFAFTADATGLQSFPQRYSGGVPLGTQSDWGWHSFPNTNGYLAENALKTYDFGHGHPESYSVENKDDQRSRDAANYLRANPHRMHLGIVGLDIPQDDAPRLEAISQKLNLWKGALSSDFNYRGSHHHTTTCCHPERDMLAFTIHSDSGQVLPVKFRYPYPTGKHSDDACDWQSNDRHKTQLVNQDARHATLKRILNSTVYYVTIHWEDSAVFAKKGDHYYTLTAAKDVNTLRMTVEYSTQIPDDVLSADSVRVASASYWERFWNEGGIADFSRCTDERAKELERRVVLSQYLLAVNCAGETPPQETGLTYNSWFGKFHLEMIWWHQAQFALWGHPQLLERTLDWYFKAAYNARQIAQRQGFSGLRWMKMTDPTAEEAPSKVGSFLIWQQPHIIYLAELLFRAKRAPGYQGKGQDAYDVINKYNRLVQETADFMYSFATHDEANNRYTLRGVIPAQETLRASETVNPPFELSYWRWATQTALDWRKRSYMARIPEWADLVEHMSPLAFNEDSLYLAAETATDTYKDIRFTSDHPAVLGAVGILPMTPQVNPDIMRKTLNWIWDNWNWNKTWGWDYPMVAMNAARMGDPQKAVDALLMDKRTNTYLVSGHNYQDQRLRIYLPGNGGLLTAVAMMCAGWDGAQGQNPGFPNDGTWDVQWEGLLPLP